jgi:hypothetical protein
VCFFILFFFFLVVKDFKTEKLVKRGNQRNGTKGIYETELKEHLVLASVAGVMEWARFALLVAVGTIHTWAVIAGNTGMGVRTIALGA